MERALNSMEEKELIQLMEDLGEPRYRARQLFHFFHKEKQEDLSQAKLLPAALRDALQAYPLCTVKEEAVLESKDGSRKFLFRMRDQALVESVWMPYADRVTACISTQVGCRMGCAFCASTKAPFVRSLEAGEILGQVYQMERCTASTIDNLVIMGIGEPLDNYEELVGFLRLITAKEGKHLSARSITLSTCGLVPKIRALAREGLPINLAISLHASSDADRQRTMPIAKKYRIAEIREACLDYFRQTGRRISLEYVLIEGMNDRKKDVDRLAALFRGPMWHINLLPLNPISEFSGQPLSDPAIERFRALLEKRGLTVSVRRKRGADIDAACGQLRILYQALGGGQ